MIVCAFESMHIIMCGLQFQADSIRFDSIMSMVLAINEQFYKHNYAHTRKRTFTHRNRRAFTLPLRYQITLIDVNGHGIVCSERGKHTAHTCTPEQAVQTKLTEHQHRN